MAPGLGSSKIVGTGSFVLVYRRVIGHWWGIILVVILGVATVPIAYGDFFDLITLALFLLFIASQIFWIGRILDLGERFNPGKPRRAWLAIMAGLVYLFVFLYSYSEWGLSASHVTWAADYRPQSMLIHAAFWWWFVGSLLAFLLVIAFGAVDRAARAAWWVYRRARTTIHRPTAAPDAEATLPPPGRRRFLEHPAVLVRAPPFVAAACGVLSHRQDVEIVRQRVRLARLPKAFEGFHIAQLSDIHI